MHPNWRHVFVYVWCEVVLKDWLGDFGPQITEQRIVKFLHWLIVFISSTFSWHLFKRNLTNKNVSAKLQFVSTLAIVDFGVFAGWNRDSGSFRLLWWVTPFTLFQETSIMKIEFWDIVFCLRCTVCCRVWKFASARCRTSMVGRNCSKIRAASVLLGFTDQRTICLDGWTLRRFRKTVHVTCSL